MKLPTLHSADADELPPEDAAPAVAEPAAPTTRGRGRPPALNADGSRKHPPRAAKGTRPDRAPRRAKTAVQVRQVSRKTRIQDALTDLSAMAYIVPMTREDALTAREVELLADGLDKECRRSPRFAKLIDRLVAVKGTAGVIAPLVIIIARRISRHKVGGVPAWVDPALAQTIHDDGTPAHPLIAALNDPEFAAQLAQSEEPTAEPTPLVASIEDRAREVEARAAERNGHAPAFDFEATVPQPVE